MTAWIQLFGRNYDYIDNVEDFITLIKRIQNWTSKIAKMELDLKHKDDNKEVSLGTSKVKTREFCYIVDFLTMLILTTIPFFLC